MQGETALAACEVQKSVVKEMCSAVHSACLTRAFTSVNISSRTVITCSQEGTVYICICWLKYLQQFSKFPSTVATGLLKNVAIPWIISQ